MSQLKLLSVFPAIFTLCFLATAGCVDVDERVGVTEQAVEGTGDWGRRALNIQAYLDDGAPLAEATWAGSHNSYNSAGHVYLVDPNQKHRIREQLQRGARELTFDVFLDPETKNFFRLCHGECGIDDLRLGTALGFIKTWMDNHSSEVVLLKFEITKGNIGGKYSKLANKLRDVLDGYIYEPNYTHSDDNGGSYECRGLNPQEVTEADIVAAGANILLYTNVEFTDGVKDCPENNKYNALMFQGFEFTHDADLTSKHVKKFNPIKDLGECENLSIEERRKTMLRGFDNRTFLGIGSGTFDDLGLMFSDANVRDFHSCGQNVVEVYNFDATSGTHALKAYPAGVQTESFVWSWDHLYPTLGTAGPRCAMAWAAGGHFRDSVCSTSRRVACRQREPVGYYGEPHWVVSTAAVPFANAASTCQSEFGSGWKFAVPHNKLELNRLRGEQGGASVWVNYRRPGAQGTPWISTLASRCGADSDGDGSCNVFDLCVGNDTSGDSDSDGVCDDTDPCPNDAGDDSDNDGSCDSVDVCTGDDRTGDGDGDGYCTDLDVCPASALVTSVDNIPPTAACTGATLECTGSSTPVAVACTGVDPVCDPSPVVTSSAHNAYSVGEHQFSCQVVDAAGNVDSTNCAVVVTDTVAPTLSCAHVTVDADASCMGHADPTATATDLCDTTVTSQRAPTATQWPLGVTHVVHSSVDVSGNEGTCDATVEVVDVTQPEAGAGPDHGGLQADASCRVTITATGDVADNCGVASARWSYAGAIVSPTAELSTELTGLGSHTLTLTACDAAGSCVSDDMVAQIERASLACFEVGLMNVIPNRARGAAHANGKLRVSGTYIPSSCSDVCTVSSLAAQLRVGDRVFDVPAGGFTPIGGSGKFEYAVDNGSQRWKLVLWPTNGRFSLQTHGDASDIPSASGTVVRLHLGSQIAEQTVVANTVVTSGWRFIGSPTLCSAEALCE